VHPAIVGQTGMVNNNKTDKNSRRIYFSFREHYTRANKK
jgi:hypothetical protein